MDTRMHQLHLTALPHHVSAPCAWRLSQAQARLKSIGANSI
jgi:hypothetical protein